MASGHILLIIYPNIPLIWISYPPCSSAPKPNTLRPPSPIKQTNTSNPKGSSG